MRTTLLRDIFLTDFRLWLKGMTLLAIVLVVSLTVAAWTVAAAEFYGDMIGDGVYGAGGLKEAIQDLYAEIIESESVDGRGVGADGGDSPHTPRLDDVASAKAKFVSDSLRRMIGNGETTGGEVVPAEGGGGGGTAVERTLRDKKKEVIDALKRFGGQNGVDDRTMSVVDLLMDKCVEIALANKAAVETTTASLVDVVELERHFHEMLDQFERSTETVCGRGVRHKSRTSRSSAASTAKQPTTLRPPPTTKPTRPPRRPSPRSVGRFRVPQLQSERPPSDVRR